ncbi:MAG: ABC transporter ATP-binding protein [bacterium]|nr:ABC transporter ATP-binding protein [bacterium]
MSVDDRKGTLKRLYGYMGKYKIRIAGGIFCTVFMGIADAAMAPIFGWLIDGLSQIGDSLKDRGIVEATLQIVKEKRFFLEPFEFSINNADQAKAVLLRLGGFMIFLMIFKGVFVYSKEYLMNSVIQKIVKRLRDQLFSHLLRMKMEFFEKGKTGEIMSRLTNDVQIIEQSLGSMVVLIQSFVTSLIFITALLYTDWKLTLFALAIFPGTGFVIRMFARAIRKASRKIMAKIADINAFLQESISAVKIIKTYNREEYEEERFGRKTYSNYSYSMRASRLVAFLKPTNEFMSTIGMTAVILYCGYRILSQDMDIAIFATFAALIVMAYKPIKTLGETLPIIQKALASSERVFDVLDKDTEMDEQSGKDMIAEKHGKVNFDNVNFSYNGKDPVLRGLSFDVEAGETIALVGPSGVGKSTVINLLLKFYDSQSGRILIDDKEIKSLAHNEIRDMMSLVPQETILFSGSVKDNIRYGNLDASDEDVINAAKAANAHDFITELSEGYETEIGERGVQISGGQRQRLAIARAILKDPVILLLDEATSALDSESEALVQEATYNLMQNRTAFVIAHRLSTVKNSDKIAVMDQGKVVELGSHDELIKKGGLYKTLHNLQFR